MFKYTVYRLLSSLPVLIIISIVAFAIIQIPEGDYADLIKSQSISQGGLSEQEAQRIADEYRKAHGLQDPMWAQYFRWVKNIILAGDFGMSFIYNKPVSELIAERLPRTLGIALACHVIATLLGVSIGIYAATKQYSVSDKFITLFSFIGMTVPRFVFALIIVYFYAYVFQSTNIGGLYSPEYILEPFSFAKFIDMLNHIWPIILIAAFGGMAYNLRVMRGNLLDVLRMQYIETARAKGLSEKKVILHHAVPNALHPLVMYQGVAFPYMIQGEIEVAIVLGVPTLGPLLITSMETMDIYVTSSIFLMISFILIIGNLIADLILARIDPRIRIGQ